MHFKTVAIAGAAVSLFAIPAAAHHSFAMFDQTRVFTLEGVVTEFEWTNPHSWLYFTATGEDGESHEYAIELASVGQQIRVGWAPDTLKAGDRITVDYNPLKDGTRGGTLVQVTLPDGSKLGHGGMRADPVGAN